MIRRKRRAYLDHFHKNAAGEYIYSGDHYTFRNHGKSRRRALTELWVCCAVAAAAILAGGCIPAPGVGRCGYVLMPYVASIIAGFSVFWSLGQLTAGGDPLREYVYEDTVKKLPLRTLLTAVFSGVSCLGEVLFLILNGSNGKTGYAVLFLLLMAVACGAEILARVFLSHLEWTK